MVKYFMGKCIPNYKKPAAYKAPKVKKPTGKLSPAQAKFAKGLVGTVKTLEGYHQIKKYK